MARRMLLIDGNSLMHRAFHALPVMTNDNGDYTNALHGFMMMLLSVMGRETFDYCAVAFDMHGDTFRHAFYDQYKAGRAPTADELRPQFDAIRAILGDMHIRVIQKEGYEADDILGTMSRRCEEAGIDCAVMTGDRDAYQLAGPHTTIYYTRQGSTDVDKITPETIRERWNLTPVQLIDMKGLMGDTSDNYPGVPGVGEKTAQKLIERYGSVEAVLDHAPADQKGKLRERLIEGRESALLSKRLAAIDRAVPIDIKPSDCPLRDIRDGRSILTRYQLRQALGRLMALDTAQTDAAAVQSAASDDAACAIVSADEFRRRIEACTSRVAAVGLGTHAYVAPEGGEAFALRLGGDLIDPGLDEGEAVKLLQPLVDRLDRAVVHDLKRLLGLGLRFPGAAFDVMLAGYVINPQRKSFSLTALCADEGLALDDNAPGAALLRLHQIQSQRIERDGLGQLFDQIEMPLCRVLYDMERRGILTDEAALKALGDRFAAHIDGLLQQIHAQTGDDMNINSPKQLGVYLFETLGLKGGKKTKTGWSTSADVLESLQGEAPVVAQILEYRKYTKLKSTYIDALLRLRDGEGRVHTSFDQTATATGRISSLEPNLQNIPVRTPLGKEIRRAFVASPGCAFVDADYSQIELRVLAHMSGDEVMIDAFKKGQDIHARTAAEVYGVPLDEVTGEMRSAAKAVNFGIVYGISDFGLARNIGVSRAEAAAFIERYLARYPLVKRFMDGCVAAGNAQGYVSTLFGRRRYLPELNDRSYTMRQFGERAAMNSPIQGTAADIIKLAMNRVHGALASDFPEAKLLLQVHDELIVEAPQQDAQAVASLLKRCMEDIIALKVPLVAEVNIGRSWYDCK